MNKKFKVITIFIVTLILLTTVAYGASTDLPYTNSNNDIEINTDEMPITSRLFMGNNVNIKANFDNLVMVQGFSVKLDGTYNGDVFVFGENVELHGTFNKNVYVFAQRYTSDADIEGTMYSFASTSKILGGELEDVVGFFSVMEVNQDVVINRDLIAFGSVLELVGDVYRNVNANVESVYLKGNVDGDIKAITDVFEISETASVFGVIDNTSENKVVVSGGANLENEIKETFVKTVTNSTNYLSLAIASIASFLLVFGFIRGTALRFYSKAEFYYRKKLLNVFVSGVVFLVAFIILAFAIIFINPTMGIAFILASSALIMVAQLIAFAMAVPVVARLMKTDSQLSNYLAIVIVVIVYLALSFTTGSVMGVFKFVITIVGIGLVIYNIRFSRKEFIYEQKSSIVINDIQENFDNNGNSINQNNDDNENNINKNNDDDKNKN